ncbi:MAG: hypothetical protein GY874_01790 [Desulfobacteraceae bacterium]|nr:hypothetical protein [Desulfobacteraceae bacterium]
MSASTNISETHKTMYSAKHTKTSQHKSISRLQPNADRPFPKAGICETFIDGSKGPIDRLKCHEHTNDIYTSSKGFENLDRSEIKKRIGNKAEGLNAINTVYKNASDLGFVNSKINDSVIRCPNFICISTTLTENIFKNFSINLNDEKYAEHFKVISEQEEFLQNNQIDLSSITLDQIRSCVQDLINHYFDNDKNTLDIPYNKRVIYKLGDLIRSALQSQECHEFVSNMPSANTHLTVKTVKDDLESKLLTLFDAQKNNDHKIVAARSSCSFEDQAANPAAGLFKTEIGVETKNIDNLLKSIINVIGSMWEDPAISKYIECGSCQNEMCALVQELFFTQLSGVMFSSLSADQSKIGLTIGLGQGEQLVDGKQTGLELSINKADLIDFLKGKKELNNISIKIENSFLVNTSSNDSQIYEYKYIHPETKKLTIAAKKIITDKCDKVDLKGLKRNLRVMIKTNGGEKVKNKRIKIYQFNEDLIRIAVYGLLSELTTGESRDIEFALNAVRRVDNIHQKELHFDMNAVILQDRVLQQPTEILLYSETKYSEFADVFLRNYSELTPITRPCIQEGILISDVQFLQMHEDNLLGKDKYIIVSEGSVEPFNQYLSHNIAGFIVSKASDKDHMSTECSNRSIPILRMTKKLESLKNEYGGKVITIGCVQVNNEIKPIITDRLTKRQIISARIPIDEVNSENLIVRKNPVNNSDEQSLIKNLDEVRRIGNNVGKEWVFLKDIEWSYSDADSEENHMQRYFKVYADTIKLNNYLIDRLESYSIKDVINTCPLLLTDQTKLNEFKFVWDKFKIKQQIQYIVFELKLFAAISVHLKNYNDSKTKDYIASYEKLISNIEHCVQEIESTVELKDQIDFIRFKGVISKLQNYLYSNCMDMVHIGFKLSSQDSSLSAQEVIAYFHRQIVDVSNDTKECLGIPYVEYCCSPSSPEMIDLRSDLNDKTINTEQRIFQTWKEKNKAPSMVVIDDNRFLLDQPLSNHSFQAAQNKDPKGGDANMLLCRLYQDSHQTQSRAKIIYEGLKNIADYHEVVLTMEQPYSAAIKGTVNHLTWKLSRLNFDPDRIVELHNDLSGLICDGIMRQEWMSPIMEFTNSENFKELKIDRMAFYDRVRAIEVKKKSDNDNLVKLPMDRMDSIEIIFASNFKDVQFYDFFENGHWDSDSIMKDLGIDYFTCLTSVDNRKMNYLKSNIVQKMKDLNVKEKTIKDIVTSLCDLSMHLVDKPWNN